MKKLLSLYVLSIFIISCSEKDPVVDDNTSETTKPSGDVFTFKEIDVKSQWKFNSNQNSNEPSSFNHNRTINFLEPSKIQKLSNKFSLSFTTLDYNDSLDVGVLSIESPKTGELTSNETVSVIVGNYGYLPILDSLEISLQVKFEDGEFSAPIVETIIINDSLPPVEAMEYTFNTTLDLSEKGTYYIVADTQLQGDMDTDNNTHVQVFKSLEYTDVCNIHSLIFNEDNTFKLYTNNEEGVCNYVIFGDYELEQDSSLLKLYSPDSSQETNLIGNIYDVETDDNGEFTGTIDIEGICVQLEDGYEEENYSEGLTYIPDENLESYLIEKGIDTEADGYITNSQAESIIELTFEAEDNWELGDSFEDFYNFETRFSNRMTNLAGLEAFPSLTSIILSGHNLDSINISKNPQLRQFGANFNSFKRIDTSKNPNLEWISIDNTQAKVELDFSKNTKITMLSIDDCKVDELDLSNNDKIEYLTISKNFIQSIDLSNLTQLKSLKGSFNKLKSIDVSNNPNLEVLSLDGNEITENIDVSNCINLIELRTVGNNYRCLKVNQQQLDALNGVNVPDGFDWALGFYSDENGSIDVEVSLDCN
jgi:hypothetical protein